MQPRPCSLTVSAHSPLPKVRVRIVALRFGCHSPPPYPRTLPFLPRPHGAAGTTGARPTSLVSWVGRAQMPCPGVRLSEFLEQKLGHSPRACQDSNLGPAD